MNKKWERIFCEHCGKVLNLIPYYNSEDGYLCFECYKKWIRSLEDD